MTFPYRKMRAHTVVIGLLVAGAALWLHAQLSDTRTVASLLPAGALLYLEAKDFHRILSQWNGSSEKKSWLGSRNFQQLSVSRLIERLSQAQGEVESIAGIPVNMDFTDQVAGSRSGFAFYDFSKLTFVYATEIGENRLEGSALWRSRRSFQSREVAGVPFYLKADAASHRTVAFASYKGWLTIATDEERMAQTLTLLSGGKAPAVAGEPWYVRAVKERAEQGDLRLVYNMAAVLATPQFRSYWLHRNASELKPFSSGISDLFERADGFEEQRMMLRNDGPLTAVSPDSALADALAYSSADDSLVRGWSRPDTALIADLVQQVLGGQKIGSTHSDLAAPAIAPEAGAVGTESDLEVRIDQPPFIRPSERSVAPLTEALLAMEPTAMAHVQTTTVLRDGVFVLPGSGLVFICKNPDARKLEAALNQAASASEAGSLDRLQAKVDGKVVSLSRIDLSAGTDRRLPPQTTYVAFYNHAVEWPHYRKLFAVLDAPSGAREPGMASETPAFFSGNVGDLGTALSSLQSASIVSADSGSTVRETVRYQLAAR